MIDLTLALEHLKADNEPRETALIETYIAGAVSACEGYCNRKFYETESEKDADYAVAKIDLVAAQEARKTGLADTDDAELINIVNDQYISRRAAVLKRMNGIVVDGTIMAAMLMMLGHFYKNRQEVVVAQYSGATQLPAGARRILEPYLWIGDLAGMPE